MTETDKCVCATVCLKWSIATNCDDSLTMCPPPQVQVQVLMPQSNHRFKFKYALHEDQALPAKPTPKPKPKPGFSCFPGDPGFNPRLCGRGGGGFGPGR